MLKKAVICNDMTVDPLNPGFFKGLFPLTEQGVDRNTQGVNRAKGRVATSYYKKVAVQDSVFNKSVIGQPGFETEVRTKYLECNPRCYSLHCRCSKERHVGVPRCNALAL
ncbi:hypothetical protein SDC9_116703 [bioreactor metagenome]|uniref:Uncharacterized protein n=1 Tax=bioreactor metagenome TaxID=1076179 RepID=A0A645BWY0_9ZZZZ